MKFDKDSTWVDNKELVKVIITDIKMPLLSMIVFMVKWTIAIIPAFIILIFIAAIFSGFVTGLMTNYK